MAVTVFVISASYSQIIELFPTGGGGYLVATKLFGAQAGLVSGSALVVDYMLTITISIAEQRRRAFQLSSGVVRNLYKIVAEILLIFGLIFLNLRGVKESVMFLLPIFLLFIVMHIVVITLGVVPHLGICPALWQNSYQETTRDIPRLRAARNSGDLAARLQSRRRHLHRHRSGQQWTADSARAARRDRARRPCSTWPPRWPSPPAAFCFAICSNRVSHEPGRTLNASLFADILRNVLRCRLGGNHGSLVIVTLITEAALLVVAAQAGFLDGPRVLSNMSLDSWAPHRLSHLSDQLVTRNGVWFMGFASLAFLALQPRRGETARGHVQHQCVSDLHAVAARHVPALVGGATTANSRGAPSWRSTAWACSAPERFSSSPSPPSLPKAAG